MATKNLRKVRAWGLSGFGFSADFDPGAHPINWAKFQKYVDKKEKTMIFNSLFRPLYKTELAKVLSGYGKGRHKMTAALKKEIKESVKHNVKETIKARLQVAANPPQQGYKEQETVLEEG